VKTAECLARADLLGADHDTEELPGNQHQFEQLSRTQGSRPLNANRRNTDGRSQRLCCSPWKNERDPSEETSCTDGIHEWVTEDRTHEHGKSRWEKSARTPAPGAGKLAGRRETGRTENKNQSRQAQLVQRELRLATKRRNLAVKISSMASAQNEQVSR
jgi:hypothetical protein